VDLGLHGRKAIVIGATRGIGRAIAEVLAYEGCDLGICARNADQIDAVVAELNAKGIKAYGAVADAGDPSGLRAFIEETTGLLGGLDVYVSNASGAFAGANDEESWRKGVEVDVLGTMHGCEAALPFLENSDAGAIVLIGTVSAIEAVGTRRAYNSVKAAILPYSKSVARDAAAHNVRCNVVSPGQVLFDGGVWDLVKQHAPDQYADALARNPMGRMGRPDEVANAVAFLASPRASFISGTNLICDGARTQNVQF